MKSSDRDTDRCLFGRALPYVLMALVLMMGQGCAAPVFSDFQTARVVAEGEWEVAPVVAHLPVLDQTNAGLQAAVGVGSNVELRARYIRSFTRDLSDGDSRFFGSDFDVFDADVHQASFGPKISLVRGALAAHLPAEVAFATGAVSALAARPSLTARPTLIATVPLAGFAEVNTSVNVMLPPGLISINAGLGIGKLGTWSVRPGVGVMLNTGYVAAGIGVAYRFGGSADGP